MPYKSFKELKDSVFYLSLEAKWVKKRYPLRVISEKEYYKLLKDHLIVVKDKKVFVQTAFGSVKSYDQESEVIVCDNEDYRDCNTMDKEEFSDLVNAKVPVLLYYYDGPGCFEIEDHYGRIEKVKRGDYISCRNNGQLTLVHNFDVLYE